MKRLFLLLYGWMTLFLLAGCGGVDTEALWSEVDSAIEDIDCEAALPSIRILLDNKESLEEAELARVRSLNRACNGWQYARKKIAEENYISAANSYGEALDGLDPQLALYKTIADEVVTLYDITPLESFFTKCDVEYRVYQIPEAIFYDAGIIDKETYQAAEQACMSRLIEQVIDGSRLINISKFVDVYEAQMAILESIFSPEAFAVLKSDYDRQLVIRLETFASDDAKRTTVHRWIDDAEFLDTSIRDDFFAQAAYQKALALYEDAIELNYGYGIAIEALESFISDYPEHAYIVDVETMLAEANDGLEQVGINDDGKIAMFYSNGTPYKVQLTFEWNYSGGKFLDKETLHLPPCENCTNTSGCITSSPTESIRLIPQEYIVTLNVATTSVLPSGGPATIEESATICISLTSDFLSDSGLFD